MEWLPVLALLTAYLGRKLRSSSNWVHWHELSRRSIGTDSRITCGSCARTPVQGTGNALTIGRSPQRYGAIDTLVAAVTPRRIAWWPSGNVTRTSTVGRVPIPK